MIDLHTVKADSKPIQHTFVLKVREGPYISMPDFTCLYKFLFQFYEHFSYKVQQKHIINFASKHFLGYQMCDAQALQGNLEYQTPNPFQPKTKRTVE